MSDMSKTIADEMKETNRLAKEAHRISNRAQYIALAQHLGKQDILEDLLASFASADSPEGARNLFP